MIKLFMLGLILLPSLSFATMRFETSGMISYATESRDNVDTTKTRTDLTFALGFADFGSFRVGGELMYRKQTTKNPTVEVSDSFMAIGPRVSLPFDPSQLSFSLLMLPTRTYSTAVDTLYYGGYGIHVDYLYLFSLGGGKFGPQINLTYTTYKKTETDGNAYDLDNEAKDMLIYPMLTYVKDF